MSKLYKSNSIIVGDPLEIEIKTVMPVKKSTDKASIMNDSQTNEQESVMVQGIIQDARIKAASIMENARERSREIWEEAKRKGYEKGHGEGSEKGFEKGYEDGRIKGHATVDKLIKEAQEIRTEASKEKERMVKEAEGEIVRIIIEISKKVLGDMVEMDPEAVLGLVRKALEKCTFSNEVTMKVSPDDYDLIELSKRKLLNDIDGIAQLHVVMEDALPKGSCILETDAGCISSGMEVQLGRIEQSFKELLNYE